MRESAPTVALLPAVVAGESGARTALLRLWGPVVLRWCARLGGPALDEEDLAHEVFERVLAGVHALHTPEAFSTWLFQTTRRVVRSHQRRAWLHRWVPGLVPDVADPADGPGRLAERSEEERIVTDALAALPAPLREVLVLAELEERAGPEVAVLLELPLGTVKSRLRRARAAFEIALRRRGLVPEGRP